MKSLSAPVPFQLAELKAPTLPTWASKALKEKHSQATTSITQALKSRTEFVQRFESLNADDLLSAEFPSPDQRSRARIQQLRDELASRELILAFHDAAQKESLGEDTRRFEALKAARREAIGKLTAAGFDDFDPKTRPQCLEDWVVNQYRGVKDAVATLAALHDEQAHIRSESGVNTTAHQAVRQRLEQIRSNALREAALV